MMMRLHLNENTGGCSPAVLEALRRIDPVDVSIYPDYRSVTAACERWFDVPAGWVQLTNGLDEGLYVAAQAVARGGQTSQTGVRPGSDQGQTRVRPESDQGQTPSVLIVEPAFEEYAICAAAAGLNVSRVLWDPRAATAATMAAASGPTSTSTKLASLCQNRRFRRAHIA